MNAGRVVAGWMALIAIYTALTNSNAVAGLLGTTTAATQRLSDPTVALIKSKSSTTATPTTSTTSVAPLIVTPQTGQPIMPTIGGGGATVTKLQ